MPPESAETVGIEVDGEAMPVVSTGDTSADAESTEEDLRALAEMAGIPFVEDLSDKQVAQEFLDRIPIRFARYHQIIGFAADAGMIVVAMGNPRSYLGVDTLGRYLGVRVEPIFSTPGQVRSATNAAYEQQTGQTQQLLAKLSSEELIEEVRQLTEREDLLDSADRAPVIRLVNTILFEAVTNLASDIHIQPYETELVVRARVDGILHDANHIPKQLQEEVLSRIKVIGNMNIAEKRLPQDGRATVEVGDRVIDLRIASMPTSHGERIVIRLLDKSARLYTLSELGMNDDTIDVFRYLIHREHGIILVTGPTGSGKSTTLYSALHEINSRDRNVVTLEDPIEYQLDGISQTQINTKKGMTFASGLRNVLRQDPDIIMVGEIRDHETAVMAIQSALTGHLVFSTLHTNDSASAITRLLDLGIEPYLVSSSLIGVLAQRLVRRNCVRCCEPYTMTDDDRRLLGIDRLPTGQPMHGIGCEYCRQTGYRGRFAISELLKTTEAIREQIQARANASQILQTALASGTRLMRDDGLVKIAQGLTTPAEVSRVTVESSV